MTPKERPETRTRTVHGPAEMSDFRDPVSAPRNREVAISAALLRLLGASQIDAAIAAGVHPRTLGRWEAGSWWPEIVREASRRWLAGLAARARLGLQEAVGGDGALALRVLERLVPGLAPPKLRATLETFDYGSLTNEELEEIAAGKDPADVLGSRGR